jgi:hypothetical protein
MADETMTTPTTAVPEPATTGVFSQKSEGAAAPTRNTPEPAAVTAPESTAAPVSAPEPEPVERAVPKPEEYVLPEGMPDTVRAFAHERGFTQEQLDGTIQHFGSYVVGMQAAEQKALREMGEAHLKNWGNEAQTRLALAKRALKQNDPDGKLAEALNTSGYGNHPAVLDFLYNLGKGMQEGGFLKSAVPRSPGQKSAAQALFGGTHPSKE